MRKDIGRYGLTSSLPQTGGILRDRELRGFPRFADKRSNLTLGVRRPRSGLENVDCGVGVRIGRMAAIITLKHRLALAVMFGDRPARCAGLGRIGRVDRNQKAASGFEFVSKKGCKLRPALFQNSSIETSFGAHMATGLADGTPRASGHARGLKVFDNHRTIGVGDPRGLHMVEVLTDASRFSFGGRKFGAGFSAADAPFLAPCKSAGLLSRSPVEELKSGLRHVGEGSIRQSQRMGDAAINTNGRSRAGLSCVLNLTSNADVPPQRVSIDGDVADNPHNGAGPAETDPSDFWQSDATPVAVKAFDNNFSTLKPERIVDAFFAGSRITRASGKEIVVSRIKVSQRLLLAGLADGADKVDLTAQVRQLARLAGHGDHPARLPFECSPMIAPLLKAKIVDQSYNPGELHKRMFLVSRRGEFVPIGPIDHRQSLPARQSTASKWRTHLLEDSPND